MLPYVSSLAKGILSNNRSSLARAITLIESTLPEHKVQAEHLLDFFSKSKESKKEDRKLFKIGVAGNFSDYNLITY